MLARVLIILSLASGGVASAQPGTVAPESPPLVAPQYGGPQPLAPVGYGRSIAAADGIAAGLLSGAFLFGLVCVAETWGDGNEDSGSCMLAIGTGAASIGTYALAPPIIHLSHARPAQALASLGLRVGLPVAAGVLVDEISDDEDGVGWAVVGGLGAAILIDWLVLAQPDEAPKPRAFTPAVMPSRGGGTVGLVGRF